MGKDGVLDAFACHVIAKDKVLVRDSLFITQSIFAVLGDILTWSISCVNERISSTGTPAFKFTSIEISCPARVAATGGLILGRQLRRQDVTRSDGHREHKFICPSSYLSVST
jgi:hypothetical protein